MTQVLVALSIIAFLHCCGHRPNVQEYKADQVHNRGSEVGQLAPDGITRHSLPSDTMQVGETRAALFRLIPDAHVTLVFFDIQSECATARLNIWHNLPSGLASDAVMVEKNVPVELDKDFEYFVQVVGEVQCQPSTVSFLVKEYEKHLPATVTESTPSPPDGLNLPPPPALPNVDFEIEFIAKSSDYDRCSTSFVWEASGPLRLVPSSTERLLRIERALFPIPADAAWIPFLTDADLQRSLSSLRDKSKLKITAEENCRTSADVVIASANGLILFENDEKSLVDDELSRQSTIWKPDLSVEYQYEAEKHEWAITIPKELSSAMEGRVFSRRSRTFLTKRLVFSQLARGFKLKIDQPDLLRRILPYQERMELLLRVQTDIGWENRTIRLTDILARDGTSFRDKTLPGRSPYLLTEQLLFEAGLPVH